MLHPHTVNTIVSRYRTYYSACNRHFLTTDQQQHLPQIRQANCFLLHRIALNSEHSFSWLRSISFSNSVSLFNFHFAIYLLLLFILPDQMETNTILNNALRTTSKRHCKRELHFALILLSVCLILSWLHFIDIYWRAPNLWEIGRFFKPMIYNLHTFACKIAKAIEFCYVWAEHLQQLYD